MEAEQLVGKMARHLPTGAYGKVARVHPPGEYGSPLNNLPVGAYVVELESGDTFVFNPECWEVMSEAFARALEEAQRSLSVWSSYAAAMAVKEGLGPEEMLEVVGMAIKAQSRALRLS